MNLLDLLLVVAIVLAVLGGLRVGLITRAATWIGLAVGVLLSTWTVPTALMLVDSGTAQARLFLGLAVLAITITLVTTLFQTIGLRARLRLAGTPLSRFDRVAGGLAGAVGVLVLAWLLLPAMADIPGNVARQVRSSTIADAVATLSPPPPDTTQTLRRLFSATRFPEVLADLQQTPDTGPPPEVLGVEPQLVARVTASTVNVEARGCGPTYEGSGFTVAPELVVTNAHVVAGADQVAVGRPDGARRDATVVAFDPNRDLALLEVADLGQEPLPLAPLAPGEEAFVVGYPGGQDHPRPTPARVDDRRTALGRDIYGRERTEREVLFLAADLQRGDSGSPVVALDGRVGGVVFAISPDVPTAAYALHLDELQAILTAPRQPDVVGACL